MFAATRQELLLFDSILKRDSYELRIPTNGVTYMVSKNQLRKVIESANLQLKNPELTNIQDRQRLIILRESAYTAIKALQAGQSEVAANALVLAGIQTADRSAKGYASTFNKQMDVLEFGKYRFWHKKHILSTLPLNTAGAKRNVIVVTGIKAATVTARNTHTVKQTATDAATYKGTALALMTAAEHCDNDRKRKTAINKAKKLVALGQVAETSQGTARAMIAVQARDSYGVAREMTAIGKRP
jgi:hypothetical protein